jgi:ubiquinone/menaquinone biosynthesis C-methylase UbiE
MEETGCTDVQSRPKGRVRVLHSTNERVYNNGIERLRSAERKERLELDRVVQLCLKAGEIKSLLDIGTGSALFAEAFAKLGITVTGVDINPEMIEAARRHLPAGKFSVAPAEQLPFDDNAFDATFFGVVFHEVDDYGKALQEAFRVSRKSTFILEWPHAQQEFGPPLEHRVRESNVRDIAGAAGYDGFEAIPLNTLVLYILRK